jgi:hypothetical protein
MNRLLPAVLLSLLALGAGCDDPGAEGPRPHQPDPTTELPTEPTEPEPTEPTGTEPTEPPDTTWYADVEPLVFTHCAGCHNGSGIGPGDFTDAEYAALLAPVMLARVDAGEMPPPAADPDCNSYEGAEQMVLPEGAREVLARWVELGAPLGDPADSTGVLPPEPPELSRRDVVLEPPAGYVPDFTDGNEYRCFLLDGPVTHDQYIAGFEFLPDNDKISHHALFFIDTEGQSHHRITDPATHSWKCDEQLGFGGGMQMVHAWAPGGGALEFPDDMGLLLPEGSQVVMQLHYFEGEPDPAPDVPAYALKLEPTVDDELTYTALGPVAFEIPAGDPVYTATLDIPMFWLTLGLVEYEVYGLMPHMHVLGTGYEFKAVEPDGDEKCLARAEAYDFDLQPTYWFDHPVTVDPEDTLSLSCTWDNSAGNPNQINDPPIDVTFGEKTQDEMCLALMYVRTRLAF